MDEEEKRDRMLARRYATLVGIRWGIFGGMVMSGGIISAVAGLGFWETIPIGLLLGAGGVVVGLSLTRAMAPWVWPEEGEL